MGYSPRGRKESDMTERLHFTFKLLLLVSIDEISLFCCCDSPAMGTIFSGLSSWHISSSSFVFLSLKFMPANTSSNLDKFSSSQELLLTWFHDC